MSSVPNVLRATNSTTFNSTAGTWRCVLHLNFCLGLCLLETVTWVNGSLFAYLSSVGITPRLWRGCSVGRNAILDSVWGFKENGLSCSDP